MAKIVKFCDSCEESFAEKFGFCPNCGEKLQAFEMNPLGGSNGASKVSEPVKSEAVPVKSEIKDKTSPVDPVKTTPIITHSATAEPIVNPVEAKNIDTPKVENVQPAVKAEKVNVEKPVVPAETPKTFAASAAASSGANGNNGNKNRQDTLNSNTSHFDTRPTAANDDGFHVTVIEEKNVKQRNTLLLGALFLMTTVAVGSTVYSLFNKDLLVGAIGDDGTLSALVAEVEPPPMETEPPPKKDKDDGGGGGGGGKENPEPASKGRLPSQVEKPVMPPQPLPQLTNPSLPNPNVTQGVIKREKTDEPVGIPGSLASKLSSGMGSGGGIGGGRGTGVGGGIGTGEGNGIGSGSGNGNGNGVGNGTGNGTGTGVPPPPPPKRADPPKPAVTQAMRIVSKPRANYTDAARQNQVQGTVTLRVTFLASGQIGSISPVSGLPYGLTEQAIAAARSIRFEPQMVNGNPATVTKQVQYSFTIY